MTQETIRQRNREISGSVMVNDTSATKKLCDHQYKLKGNTSDPACIFTLPWRVNGQCDFSFNQFHMSSIVLPVALYKFWELNSRK